jgi:hypothetical protein
MQKLFCSMPLWCFVKKRSVSKTSAIQIEARNISFAGVRMQSGNAFYILSNA